MREYRTIKALRAGEVVNLNGIKLVMDAGVIQPGDLYVAERNTGPKLLTAREIMMSECGFYIDLIVPTGFDYCFDGDECVKVREA